LSISSEVWLLNILRLRFHIFSIKRCGSWGIWGLIT
jgi:hypothetical protein